jgi:hypothetical protein
LPFVEISAAKTAATAKKRVRIIVIDSLGCGLCPKSGFDEVHDILMKVCLALRPEKHDDADQQSWLVPGRRQ